MDIDANFLAEQIEDAVEAFGSTVALPLGVKLKAVKVTNEREMMRLLKIEGQPPDKVTTVFLFDATARNLVSKGTRIVNLDGAFLTELITTEVVDDIVVYVAAGSYEAT